LVGKQVLVSTLGTRFGVPTLNTCEILSEFRVSELEPFPISNREKLLLCAIAYQHNKPLHQFLPLSHWPLGQ